MPLLSPSDTNSKAPPPADKDQGRRVLLVVDDEEGPRQSLRIVFKDEYRVILADNGTRALELARQPPVSAAILDIRMTGMSGIDLLRNLKATNPAIEVIMLTAFETLDTARQALRLGACDYLNKPFDIPTLRAAVANAMTRSALNEGRHTTNSKLRSLRDELENHRLSEEMSRTKGDIYASVLHDINSPLTVIAGFVEMINEKVCRPQPLEEQSLDELRHQLSHVSRQVKKRVEICHRYLAFARNRSPGSASVPINQTLNDLGELLRVHPSARNHQLAIRPLDTDAHAPINGTDLIQILLNLAVNAFQCSPNPHTVEILAHRTPEHLRRLLRNPLPCPRFLRQLPPTPRPRRPRRRPRHPIRRPPQTLRNLLLHQSPRSGHRPRPRHRPKPHPRRPRRHLRPLPPRQRHHLHHLPSDHPRQHLTVAPRFPSPRLHPRPT